MVRDTSACFPRREAEGGDHVLIRWASVLLRHSFKSGSAKSFVRSRRVGAWASAPFGDSITNHCTAEPGKACARAFADAQKQVPFQTGGVFHVTASTVRSYDYLACHALEKVESNFEVGGTCLVETPCRHETCECCLAALLSADVRVVQLPILILVGGGLGGVITPRVGPRKPVAPDAVSACSSRLA